MLAPRVEATAARSRSEVADSGATSAREDSDSRSGYEPDRPLKRNVLAARSDDRRRPRDAVASTSAAAEICEGTDSISPNACFVPDATRGPERACSAINRRAFEARDHSSPDILVRTITESRPNHAG